MKQGNEISIAQSTNGKEDSMPTQYMKVGEILTLSLAGKPYLKDALEKKINEINKGRVNPMKINVLVYELINQALKEGNNNE